LRFADPKPHERIAVLGIGGLGHLAVQYSAITHSKDKEDLASKLGADLIVSNGERLKQAGGADVILVTSNSYKAASELLKGLRPDGRMILMGLSDEPLIVTAEIIGTRDE
jgi:alcohol dehydrogenase